MSIGLDAVELPNVDRDVVANSCRSWAALAVKPMFRMCVNFKVDVAGDASRAIREDSSNPPRLIRREHHDRRSNG